MSDKKLIWLASYPKSGNTWVRLFLHALGSESGTVDDLEKIEATNGIASARGMIEEQLGIDSDEISNMDIQLLRPDVYRRLAKESEKDLIIKTHDAAFHAGIFLFPKEVTKKAILIVRNPFDMVASYANHMSCSIEKAVFNLCNGKSSLAKNKKSFTNQVEQYMGSWSDFYNSWKNAHREHLEVIKYEDLKQNSFETFKKIVVAIGWDKTDEEIQKAIDEVEFSKIKKVEAEKGFKEKPRTTKSFFRNGELGGWKNEITQEQANTLIDRHFYTLLELNYIDNKGNILV